MLNDRPKQNTESSPSSTKPSQTLTGRVMIAGAAAGLESFTDYPLVALKLYLQSIEGSPASFFKSTMKSLKDVYKNYPHKLISAGARE